jgi:steroid delta-isomerase-like uncharacterized protein
MSTDQNKEIIRRGFEEGINKRNYAYFDETIGENYVNHMMPQATGPEGLKQIVGGFVAGFPDMQITVEDLIAEGDRVATRGFWRGTHTGDFMGIPATGREVTLPYIDVWRLENGKAVENWVSMDMMAMMKQLGLMPEPAGQENNA